MADRKYKAIIDAIGKQIAAIFLSDANDVISLTDIAKHKSNDPTAAIRNGLHNKNVIAFHGLWEQLNNSWFTPPRIRDASERRDVLLRPEHALRKGSAVRQAI